MKCYTLVELGNKIGADVQGDDQCVVTSIATLEAASAGQISFLSNPKYRSQLQTTQASAVIVRAQDIGDYQGNALIMSNPYLGYAKLAQLLDTTPDAADSIAESAVISPSAILGQQVVVGANAVIESGAEIGDNCQIGPGCFIGKNSKIGASTKLWANVTIYHGVTIGQRCIFHSASVIGSDGFGYAPDNGQWLKIPQTGGVTIGNDTEIGAGTTVDRGALDDTVIGNGVIIDNQVQIAHNDIIGDNTAIAGTTVLAGSVTIGKNCIIGGACAINGHMTICDGVTITGMTMVIKNITEPGVYSSGMPSQTNREWRKNAARYRQLDEMSKRLKVLEAKLKD
ncbi:MAG: UDP-3-O-(3-hydroxymyristoyl)glucosamine N-acyltransferase [Gammaproteobacteria bacterium]|nr:UDP-3-O-(3-hydroxymyristoyl)glucosamine N-acyltransferase [Gammaproteobacteria bacterium]